MKIAIPDDWDGETWCRWSVCWPDSELWKGILLGFITTAQRGRFWDERTGSIKTIQDIGRQIFDNNFPLECVIMSCGDATALIEALNTNFANLTEAIAALQLAVTVQPASPTITVSPANPTITVNPASPDVNLTCSPDVNLTCRGGGYGPGGPTSPGYGPYGQGPINQPPANPGQTTPGSGPGGYDPPASWPGTPTEYDEYKCKAATFLVDAYIDYVDGWARNIENISSLNDITTWMWAVFERTPWIALLSPNLISLIGWYLGTLEVGLAVEEQFLDEYLDYLRGIEQDWICDFYNATSVEGARDVALNYVGGGGLIAWPAAITEFHVDVFFKNYVLNVLFEEHELVTAYDGTVDCSGCGTITYDLVHNVTIIDTEFSVTSSPPGGTSNNNCHGVYLMFSHNGSGFTSQKTYRVTVDGAPNVVPCYNGSGTERYQRFYYMDQAGVLLAEGPAQNTEICCSRLQVISNEATPFTLDVTIEECTEEP